MNERRYWILLARVSKGMLLSSVRLAVRVIAHVCSTQTEKPFGLLSIVMWLTFVFPLLAALVRIGSSYGFL